MDNEKMKPDRRIANEDSSIDDTNKNNHYEKNTICFSAIILKLIGILLSVCAILVITIFSGGICGAIYSTLFQNQLGANIVCFLLVGVVYLIGITPGIALFGLGKLVEAAHIYTENNANW